MLHPLLTTFSRVRTVRPFRLVRICISARSLSTDQGYTEWIRPRQCIIDTDYPPYTDKGDVLKTLHDYFHLKESKWFNFLMDRSDGRKHFRHDEALVILATPKFARWLEDDTAFLPKLLSTVVGHSESTSENPGREMSLTASPFEVDIICACVDGLPPRVHWIQTSDARYTREGLAFLHGPTTQIVPGLWETETSQDYAGLPASITFSSYVEPENTKPFTEVTLPLANTLFVTGKPSSVSISKWRFLQNEKYEKVKSTTKSHQVINVFGSKKEIGSKTIGFPAGHIPAIPLTPPRRVMSGLGNIIREISLDGENACPASSELEVTINQYTRAMGKKDSRVTVWALVTPSESMPDPPLEVKHSWADLDAVKEYWMKDSTDHTFIGAWLDRGATLCSILSGGGGWGPSQGLLSLDPQVTPGAVAEAQFPFSGLGEEQNELSLEGIVKPGSFVQFFLMPEQKEIQPMEVLKLAQGDAVNKKLYALTAIGSVPALDNVQPPAAEVNKTTESKRVTFFRNGHFGAVSESGLFLNSATVNDDPLQEVAEDSERILVKSKINAPFSYFYKDHVPQPVKIKAAKIKAEKHARLRERAVSPELAPRPLVRPLVRRYHVGFRIQRVLTDDPESKPKYRGSMVLRPGLTSTKQEEKND